MRAFAKAASAGPTTRGNGSTFSIGVLAAMLACAAALLGIGASAASAAPETQPGFVFKGQATDFSNYSGTNPIAFAGGGNIAVADTNGGRVRIFTTDGSGGASFLTEFSTPIYPNDVAADPGDGTIYAQDPGLVESAVIFRYVSDGQPTPTYTRDPGFEVPPGKGIQVDPGDHTLLVAGGDAGAIYRYDTAGTLTATLETPGFAPKFIALAADGTIWTASSDGTVKHLSSAGAELGGFSAAAGTGSIAIDPVSGRVVVWANGKLFLYTSAGALLSESAANGNNYGPIFGGNGLLYAAESSTINVYGPAVIPGVEGPVVSAVTGHGAHVEAEIDLGEGEPGKAPAESKVRFEYSADGGQTWQATPYQELTEPGLATVADDLTGLLASFEYLVRAVAKNSGEGVSKTSSAVSFSTAEVAPDVETGTATGLGETSATLNGTVNPNGLQTTYRFEYGTTIGYGSRIPVAADAVAGNQRTSRSFADAISGLTPGTTYHYRIVATNSIGESAGNDRTFTTAPVGGIAPTRAYELVTPVDKRGAQVANDLRYQAAPGGSAFAANLSAGPSDGNSSMIRQSYVMWRGADGWSDWVNTDAPQAADPVGYHEASTMAYSEDFTKALVLSNRDLAPGGIAGGGNLYVRDLKAGTYTFVAGAPGGSAYASLGGLSIGAAVFVAGAPDFSWILFRSVPPMVPGATENQLYRWTSEEGLSLESRLSDGSIPPPHYGLTRPNDPRIRLPLASAEGSLVAFDLSREIAAGFGGVYVRENGQSTAISVSHRAGDDPTEVKPGIVDWVTPSGRYVFFHTLSADPLTDDTNSSDARDNGYRYDTETGDLIFTSPMVSSGGTLTVNGVGDDGQTIYLFDGSNTVVWHEGQLDIVNSENLATTIRGHYVTDSGRYIAWTGADNEAHLYDLESGDPVCVSCPTAGSSLGGARVTPFSRGLGNVSPRSVLEDGTMFFSTRNPLLPADHNSTKDVYSYKDGYLALISPGNANLDAEFLDASEDGKDVYFQTQQGILPQDVDASTDVYDARVGGGFPQQQVKVVCSGEGCRGPAGTAPQGPAIGSADSGQSGEPAISRLKPLGASDKAKLAKGKKVLLKVQVGGPGKVKVVGTASVGQVIAASKQARQAGAVSVPIKLSKKGLKELNREGSLAVRLTVSLDGGGQKVASFTLKSAGPKKGGFS